MYKKQASFAWIIWIISLGCGQEDESHSSDSQTLSSSCTSVSEASFRCTDYTELPKDLSSGIEAACSSDATTTRTYSTTTTCTNTNKLGSCSLQSDQGYTTTAWTYKTGDDTVDEALASSAKTQCESSQTNPGTWTPSS